MEAVPKLIMGLDEDNKIVEEEVEQHIVIPESSIQMMLQFRDISQEILTLLSQDASFMVRQVLHYARQFMVAATRDRLTTKDVDKALNLCNGFLTFGHSEKKPLKYKRVQNFFTVNDREIDVIKSMEASEKFITSSMSSVTVQWALPAKNSDSDISATGQPSDRMIRIPDQSVSGKSSIVDDINDLPEDLVEYYQAVIDVVMSHDEKCVSMELENLRQNPKVCQLLPHFLTFADEEVRTLNHELRDVQKLFDFIRALMDNTFMYLGHEVNLNPLIRFLLYCITEPQEHTPDLAMNHWKVRDAASALLKCIIDDWATPVNSQYEHTLPILEKVLRDENKPLWSLYGAVVAISNLGADAIEEALHPYIFKIKHHIDKILQHSFEAGNDEVGDIENDEIEPVPGCSKWDSDLDPAKNVSMNLAQAQVDGAQRLHSALLNAAEVYMKQKTDFKMNHLRVPCSRTNGTHFYMDDLSHKSRKPLHEVYKELYNHFGETLASRLPLSNMMIYKDNSARSHKRKRMHPSTYKDLNYDDDSDENDDDNDDLPFFLNSARVASYRAKREARSTSNGDETSGSGGGGVGCDEDMDCEDEECDEDEEVEEHPPEKQQQPPPPPPPSTHLKIKQINESQGLKVIITRVEGSKK